MIVLTENKKPSTVKPVYLTEAQCRAIKQSGLLEASNLPVIAQINGVSTNPKITTVVRQDTIYDTVKAMGVPVKINAMKNVVATVQDSQTGSAVASTIYQQFGVKCTFTLPWDGSGMKLYWSPDTPPEKAPALAYAKATGLPPPNPRKYLA
jgi:hypothetical protein